MRDVFISWSKSDEAAVVQFRDRLQQVGYTVHEYSQDHTAGNIAQNVNTFVDESALALVFLSPTSVAAPWITIEVDWCYKRFTDTKGKQPILVPVVMGNVPDAALPNLLQKDPLRRKVMVSAGAPTEDDLLQVQQTVADTLKRPEPTIIPIALLAMTKPEAEKFLDDEAMLKKLLPLCSAVGMDAHPGYAGKTPKEVQQCLKESLHSRYGDHAEEFKPFPGATLRKVVEDLVVLANRRRSARKQPQLWLRWCSDDLFSNDPNLSQKVSELWTAGESILVLDSISSLHPSILDRLTSIPSSNRLASSALLWVPP